MRDPQKGRRLRDWGTKVLRLGSFAFPYPPSLRQDILEGMSKGRKTFNAVFPGAPMGGDHNDPTTWP